MSSTKILELYNSITQGWSTSVAPKIIFEPSYNLGDSVTVAARSIVEDSSCTISPKTSTALEARSIVVPKPSTSPTSEESMATSLISEEVISVAAAGAATWIHFYRIG